MQAIWMASLSVTNLHRSENLVILWELPYVFMSGRGVVAVAVLLKTSVHAAILSIRQTCNSHSLTNSLKRKILLKS